MCKTCMKIITLKQAGKPWHSQNNFYINLEKKDLFDSGHRQLSLINWLKCKAQKLLLYIENGTKMKMVKANWTSWFFKKYILHRPGIEPGPPAWQASILPLNQRCFLTSEDKTYVCNSNLKLQRRKHVSFSSVIFDPFLVNSTEVRKHRWFSGRMLACHAGGPGSIPGRCRIHFLKN